jgi:hypothetical protein
MELQTEKTTRRRRSVRVAVKRTKQTDKVAEMYGRTLLREKVSSAQKSTKLPSKRSVIGDGEPGH